MTNHVDFDALTRKTIESNGAMDDLNALYRAAFALSEWHFIPRGELPKIHPYIAADPQYADNQPLIRAFTDTDRLARFARENDLARADGSCDILSVPTENIIDYLEKFTAQGAYGIWFNSDTKSDGFYVPLKQLRPIKTHLDKLERGETSGWGGETSAVATLIVQIKDGLMLPSGFVKPADYTCHIFCRVPAAWTEGEQMKPKHLEKIYAQFYGAGWRAGNSDGSRYVLFDTYSKTIPAETARTTKWSGTKSDEKNRFWFYIADAAGGIKTVSPEEFQKDVDGSSGAENADLMTDSEMDGSTGVNQFGAISFDTLMDAFYEAIVPHLKDYKGSGEYSTLLAFDPRGIGQMVESTDANQHGAYLLFRRFVYLNPKNHVTIEIHSIQSNLLRHVETQKPLRLSFELCKNLDNRTAALYFAILGEGGEVRKLAAAVRPALARFGYEPII